ncbi:MAG: hypothetical protein ACI9I0_001982 [Rhodoferax sp.]|jgi:hypothetical protein
MNIVLVASVTVILCLAWSMPQAAGESQSIL